MRSKTKTFREKVIESSVIIGAIIIFVGFLKQYLFYNHFGINIHQFLTLDEVLILFLADLAYMFYLFLLAIGYILILFIIIRIGISSSKNPPKEKEVESFCDEFADLFYYQKKGRILIVSIVINAITFLLFYIFNNTITTLFLALFSFQTTIFFINWLTDSKENDITILISFFVGLSALLLCKNKIDITNIESQSNRIVYTVELKDKTIRTSSDTFYLGKTKDYLYLFNNKDKESIILKVEELKGIKQTNLK